MTLVEFNARPAEQQLTLVFLEGTFLALRWEEKGRLMFYYLPDGVRGFFIEIGYHAHDGRAVVLRRFISSVTLEAYAHWVRLPEG
jgi:hypothetical protein